MNNLNTNKMGKRYFVSILFMAYVTLLYVITMLIIIIITIASSILVVSL